ncbi:MAG TPA: MFS transporter [Candidatus Acidoferrum sp.]|nr:MFS transporter [Candidatus Acidoferrum sp.]
MELDRDEAGKSARRKAAIRLLPFVFLLYVVCYVDRVNVSFANLRMSADLGFTDRIFGLGAGIFFVGYVLFEVPGALIVERWSARKWMTRIMISWGAVTIGTGFIHTANQFYVARLLLGAAEAGFFPGMIVYLTHWFVAPDRAKAIGSLYAGLPAASVVGSLMAGWLLSLHWLGMTGWRWLFIVEGIPPVVLGVITFFYLTDRPREAKWLTESEREWLQEELAAEAAAKKKTRDYTIWQAFRDKKVWMLILPYFLAVVGAQASIYWIPTFIRRLTGLPSAKVALIAAIPGLVGIAGMLWNGWHSDKTGERRWHSAVPLLCAASAYLLLANTHNTVAAMTLLVLGGGIFYSYYPVYWSMPTLLLSESAAAASFGLINSIGHTGGFFGPTVVGYLNDRTGKATAAFWLIGICYLLAGGLLSRMRVQNPQLTVATELPARSGLATEG